LGHAHAVREARERIIMRTIAFGLSLILGFAFAGARPSVPTANIDSLVVQTQQRDCRANCERMCAGKKDPVCLPACISDCRN
jgi:hypothetical protein